MIAGVVRERVREGRDNAEIWAEIQPRFRLPDDRKWGYPAWYRAEMKRKAIA
jgi:hypothetical protein